MNWAFRIIAPARAGLAAVDWRGLARRGAILGAALGRWTLVRAYRTIRLAVRLARVAGRAGVRAGLCLARWAVRQPRAALGSGLAASLAVAAALLFWPEPVPRFDLTKSLDCLALNIYHEARGEPVEGKIAVGQVVMNRVQDPYFPGQVCEVVKQGGARFRDRCQFSWWCDGRSDRPDDLRAWQDSRGLARNILDGLVNDPTRGALWYHAEHVSPEWQMDLLRQGKIGRHVFYIRQAQ